MGLGYEAYESGEKTGMVFSWRHQQSERDGCGTRMRFRGFGRQPQCEEFSVIRKLASLALCGGQKNYMRHVRQNMARLVRPKSAAGSGFVLWRHAGISGVRDSSGTLSKLRQSEARATG